MSETGSDPLFVYKHGWISNKNYGNKFSSFCDDAVRKTFDKYENNKNYLGNICEAVGACCMIKVVTEDYCSICAQNQRLVMTDFACEGCSYNFCRNCYDEHFNNELDNFLMSFKEDTNECLYVNLDGDMYSCDESVPENSDGPRLYNLKLMLESLVSRLSSKTQLMFYIDEDVRGIYFQDKFMKTFYQHYPEYLSLHYTAKIVELQTYLYTLIAEDANGHCEIVGGCFLFDDNESGLEWMLKVFKRHHSQLQETRVFLLDNRIDARVFENDLEMTKISLSRFHSLQFFKAELQEQEVSRRDMSSCLKLLESALLATTEEEYEVVRNKFLQLPLLLASYFECKWHSNRDIWAISLRFGSKTFLRPMDKFLRKIFKRMKVLHSLMTLEEVLNSFFDILFEYRQEHYRKISDVIQCAICNEFSIEQQMYLKLLTNYGSKLVKRQISNINKVGCLELVAPSVYKVLGSKEGEIVSIHYCSCDFYRLLVLPCRHILALRSSLFEPFFTENICSSRWHRAFYGQFYVVLHSSEIYKYESQPDPANAAHNFQEGFKVLNQLAPYVSDVSHPHFRDRAATVRLLREGWLLGFRMSVDVLNPDNSFNIQGSDVDMLEEASDNLNEMFPGV